MNLLPIAYNTYKEAIRDKILYIILMFSLVMISSSMILSLLSLAVLHIKDSFSDLNFLIQFGSFFIICVLTCRGLQQLRRFITNDSKYKTWL